MRRICFVAPLVASLIVSPLLAVAHGIARLPSDPDQDRPIEFPDTGQYLTLVADLHTHSVFSDGRVWPKVRVEEALRDGLDAIAVTEHLEWVPHRRDMILTDRNRAYEIAKYAASESDLIVINGSEITRDMPVGHINAIFLEDANPLLFEPEGAAALTDAGDYARAAKSGPPEQALQAAVEQGAFLFWNHPAWPAQNPDGIAKLSDFHRAAIERGQLHGIEVANGNYLSEEAFRIALDHDLAVLGVSDIHGLIDWDYEPQAGGHRPVTLALTTEHSAAGLREALFAGRTIVWYKNLLIGRQAHVVPLLEASITVGDARYREDTSIADLQLRNRSDARFLLENQTALTFEGAGPVIEVPPHSTVELAARPGDRVPELRLLFRVQNTLVAPRRPAMLELTVPVEIGAEAD